MENILTIDNIEKLNLKDLNLEENLEVSKNLNEYQRILKNVINSGADYIIKSMDCDTEIKDGLYKFKNFFSKS